MEFEAFEGSTVLETSVTHAQKQQRNNDIYKQREHVRFYIKSHEPN